MVFNATFNNISAISCRSVLLVEETGVPGESHRPVASHRQTLSHIVVSSTPRYEWDSNIFSGDISSGSFEIEKSISFTHNTNGVILPSLHYKFLDKEC